MFPKTVYVELKVKNVAEVSSVALKINNKNI